MKKPKIGVLGLRGIPGVMGGIETHCENLYPLLAQKDVEIILFSRRPYVDPQLKEYRHVTLVPLPCIKHKYLETYFHTLLGVWVAWLQGIDVLHLHAVGPGLFVPLARLLGMKVVFTHHGFDYKRKKWNGPAQRILQLGEALACRYAHAVIAVAEYIGASLQTRFHRPVNCLPNGVVIPTGPFGSEPLAKFGLEANQYIFALGRFVPEKGFHDLIQAFETSRAEHKKMQGIKLVIAGRADHADQYSQGLLRQANEQVVFTDYISGADLHAIFSQARLFVIPSYHEGLPIALLEALGFGLSSLASDIPAHLEIQLSPERYFKPGDIATLARKMVQYCFKPNPIQEKNQAISMIKRRYNWENVAEQTYEVYRGLR